MLKNDLVLSSDSRTITFCDLFGKLLKKIRLQANGNSPGLYNFWPCFCNSSGVTTVEIHIMTSVFLNVTMHRF